MCCSFQMKRYEAIGPTDRKPEVSLTDCYSLIEEVSRSDSEKFHLLSLKQNNKSDLRFSVRTVCCTSSPKFTITHLLVSESAHQDDFIGMN